MEVFAALIDVCTVQSCVYFQASIRETDTTLKHTHFHILPLIVTYFGFKGHSYETFWAPLLYVENCNCRHFWGKVNSLWMALKALQAISSLEVFAYPRGWWEVMGVMNASRRTSEMGYLVTCKKRDVFVNGCVNQQPWLQARLIHIELQWVGKIRSTPDGMGLECDTKSHAQTVGHPMHSIWVEIATATFVSCKTSL